VFEMASELCRRGAVCGKLYQLVYERDPLERLHLMGKAMTTLKTGADGQIVYFYVDQGMFKECGADDSYTEGFIRMARFVRGGRIMILFKEIEADVVRVSFRSRGEVDVWALARELGGGGHRSAAGATVYGELQAVMERVLAMARGALSKNTG
jgi:phosphoesterase RecJ-like protein